jgi:preprotein translocase subunit SecA
MSIFSFIKNIFGTAQTRKVRKYRSVVKTINEFDEQYNTLSDQELRAKTEEFRARVNEGETLDHLLPEAYATVKNACRRLLDSDVHISGYTQKWDMVPYDVQLLGAIAMHEGAIAEMQTGEGKTLTAVLPLYLNSLTRKPVHLVTVNDYLAERDCAWTGIVLRWLGVTTAALTNSVPPHERKELYKADVVYGTASEYGFDYLRDNSTASSAEEQSQRGYFYAIIDETDSILIDEARTPLIISGPVPESRQMYSELQEGVAALVRLQREMCSKMATEALKTITPFMDENAPEKLSKEQKKQFNNATRKLWILNKGTPRNKTLKRLMEDPDIRAEIDEWDLYYYSDQNKEEKRNALASLYILVDEKSSDFELTDKGIEAWHQSTGDSTDDFTMLDLSHEYCEIDENKDFSADEKLEKKLVIQNEDVNRKERAHNLRQLFRAQLLMEKDVDYMVQNDKIIIIDENTGRPQAGRRFSDGLHQAIEAKEQVSIQKETQTFATITLQNYFRMYDKLAGMSGTGITEAGEFKEIYKLDVLEIPTHRPCIRADANDEIYMTEREKYTALINEIKSIHEKGRPILIGTESVEISEKLARIFKQSKLPFNILNAKNHASEAEIISQAGQRAAITLSTNMAGRGTDIKLGEGIAKLGGLYVIGTTRHQSRRIDRQLRGRSARQGDPGSSKFFVSFEDSLLRLFASPNLTTLLQKLRPPEGEPISAGILNRSIETAQKRVEQRNYMIRKHTLEYDDVMNKQRQEIYSFRNEILNRDDIIALAHELIDSVCQTQGEDFLIERFEEGQWDIESYRDWLTNHYPVSFDQSFFNEDEEERDPHTHKAAEKISAAFETKIQHEILKIPNTILQSQKEEARSTVSRGLRNMMLSKIDKRWQEHLLTMDHLRTDVNLRSVAQKDPLMEFKHEAFILFDELSRSLAEAITRDIFRFEIVTPEHLSVESLLSRLQMETGRSLVDEVEETDEANIEVEAPALEPIIADPKTGRNDPCPCGSGKKYKQCCGVKSTSKV